MANDDYLPEHERQLLRRHRRPTVRQSVAVSQRSGDPEPRLDRETERPERSTGKIPSFRAQALADYAREVGLVPDLQKLLEGVLSGARDRPLANFVGTDELGLRDLETRFKQRVGRSVYVAAVEVVNRAARLRSEQIG